MTLSMRLESERMPNTANSLMRKVRCVSHGAQGPMSPAFRRRVKSLAYQGCNFFIRDRAWTPWTKLFVEPFYAVFKVALAPEANRLVTQIKFLCDCSTARTVGGHEDYAGSGNKPMRKRARFSYTAQLLSLFILRMMGFFGLQLS